MKYIFLFFLFGSVSSFAAEPVKLVVDINRDMLTQSMPVQCVFKQLDEKLQILQMPWKRGQIATKNGDADGFFIASHSPKRDEYAVFGEPIATIEWIYVTHVSNDLSPDNPEFYALQFGSIHGARRVEWLRGELKKYGTPQPINLLGSTDQTLNVLVKGELDVVLSNRASYIQTIESNPKLKDMFHVFTVRKVPGGVYFGKRFLQKNPDFLERYNNAAKKCNL
ncbi:substrate-binding periplasmic protein [Curvivirga aplysinae]|uniref:substrate-binding periplasmic protein n=1 Tax=Curvivirga aplysinae TaxID=2529852 RepID=UPI001C3FA36F|nr:transporter substrate-binding domain-containing protein [Curvivirga aplysinae]